uniref:Calcium voltage-gated channel auxiliary subunit gamma 6 n=1 Tax=Ailuropoda melanoleuca TaxID=9646 RepID=A0A7N5JJ21_AILME
MMMWSNFFMQEEDRRRREAAGRRWAQGQHQLTPEREGKIKLGLLLSAVGATLAVLAVGTEFWVELNTYKTNGSAICDAAHLGLWKMCTKRLWQADVPADRDTCGPAELPGEANCTYFKFFTTGENARIFQRTTKKGENSTVGGGVAGVGRRADPARGVLHSIVFSALPWEGPIFGGRRFSEPRANDPAPALPLPRAV